MSVLICRRCGRPYSTHCAACHRSFTGQGAFDAHRRGPYFARVCHVVEDDDQWRETPNGWTNTEPLTEAQIAALRGTR